MRFKLSLTCEGQCYPPGEGHFDDCPYPLNCEFEFERLSEDKQTAVLSMDKEIPEDLIVLCHKRMREFVPQIEIPEQIVQIRRDINDGPVPGLKFDSETSELSCDWRALFTVFYGEEFLYRKLLDDAISGRKPLLDALKVKADMQELGPEDVIMRALKAFADDNSAARKTARRARIKRQFQLLDGTEWDFGRDGDSGEEAKALKAIQQARQFAGFETWSDDDSEDDEEDDETDSQEEWETEDDGDWAEGSAGSID